jgi:ribosomal protein S18 acetylase RimI-like enzyme
VDDDLLPREQPRSAEPEREGRNERGEGSRFLSFANLVAKFHRRGVILERRLDEPIHDVTPRCCVEFGLLDPSDVDEFTRFHSGRRREYIERRIATGDLCFTARHRGALASTTWACRSRHWVPDLHFMWNVAPGEVYLYDSYTAPQYRRRYIALALDTHVLRHLRNLDLERALTAISPENEASIHSKAKVGFRLCGDLRCISLGWGVHLHHRRRFARSPEIAVRGS